MYTFLKMCTYVDICLSTVTKFSDTLEMERSTIRSSRPPPMSDSEARESWGRIKYAIGQILKKEKTTHLSWEKLYR